MRIHFFGNFRFSVPRPETRVYKKFRATSPRAKAEASVRWAVPPPCLNVWPYGQISRRNIKSMAEFSVTSDLTSIWLRDRTIWAYLYQSLCNPEHCFVVVADDVERLRCEHPVYTRNTLLFRCSGELCWRAVLWSWGLYDDQQIQGLIPEDSVTSDWQAYIWGNRIHCFKRYESWIFSQFNFVDRSRFRYHDQTRSWFQVHLLRARVSHTLIACDA